MVVKKKKSPGASAVDRAAANQGADRGIATGNQAVYIGVESGSDLETYGYQTQKGLAADPYATTGPASFGRTVTQTAKPRYKVGYLNSKDFARELGGMDPKAIATYQQYMADNGLLDKYTPGEMDKATRKAFKELVTTANQTGTTWQQALDNVVSQGGLYGPGGVSEGAGQGRGPFQAVLDDPTTLRETFQSAVQKLYGGDLPDEEVNAMVDAYRSIQMQKQEAAYNAEGTGTTIDKEPDAQAYAIAQVKAKHPQQLDRVKFQDTFSSIMDAFGGGGQ